MPNKPSTKYQYFLDATGLKCPLPILETKRMMLQLNVGEKLMIKTIDPSYKLDIKAYAKSSGNKVIELWQEQKFTFAIIEKIY